MHCLHCSDDMRQRTMHRDVATANAAFDSCIVIAMPGIVDAMIHCVVVAIAIAIVVCAIENLNWTTTILLHHSCCCRPMTWCASTMQH